MDKSLRKLSLESQFDKLGLDKEILSTKVRDNYTVSDALINYERSPLLNIKTTANEATFDINAKIRAVWTNDNAKITFDGVNKNLNIPNKMFDFNFTQEDKNNLNATGHLGRVALINGKESFMSVDKDINKLVTTAVTNIKISDTILGVELEKEKFDSLKNGKAVFVEGMSNKKGEVFDSFVQIDASKKALSFYKNADGTNQNQLSKSTAENIDLKQVSTKIEENSSLTPEQKEKIQQSKSMASQITLPKSFNETVQEKLRLEAELSENQGEKKNNKAKQKVTL